MFAETSRNETAVASLVGGSPGKRALMRQVKELQEFGAAPGPALLREGMEELEDDPFVLLRCMGVAKDGWLEYNAIGAGGAEQMSSLGKLEGKMIEAGAVPGS